MIFAPIQRILFVALLAPSILAEDKSYDASTDDPELVEAQKALTPSETAHLQSARKMLATNEAESQRVLASKDPQLVLQRMCLTIAKLERDLSRMKVMKDLLKNKGNDPLRKNN